MSIKPLYSTLITALFLTGCGAEIQREDSQISNLPHQVDIKPKTTRGFDSPESEEYLNYMKIYNLNSLSFSFQKTNGKWSANYKDSWNGKKAYYIDTDKNNQTGYVSKWSPKVGSEYLLEEGVLFKYTGTDGTKEWSWDIVSYDGINGFFSDADSLIAYGVTINDDWNYRSFLGYYDTDTPYIETDAQLTRDEGVSNNHGAFYTTSDSEDFYIKASNQNYKQKEAAKYYNYEFNINGTNYKTESDTLFNEAGVEITDTLLYELHDKYSIVIIPKDLLASGDIKLNKAVIRDSSWGTLNSYKYEGNGGGDNKVTRQELDRMIANGEDYSQVDVSGITDMSSLFMDKIVMYDITGWDVSNVTDMGYMFYHIFTPYFIRGESKFNQPIGNWDVSKVTNMSGMFSSATLFNQPVENWDVSKVTDMSGMFYNARSFNQPIGNWDVSKVTDMLSMFGKAFLFNQPIENWDVSKVTDMSSMFYSARSFNQPIGNWDVSKVTRFIKFNEVSSLEDKNIPAKFK
jgi:surface protein